MPNNIVWVLGWRPKRTHLGTPYTTKGVVGYLGWGCLNCRMPKIIVWARGGRLKHPYHCTPSARKGVSRHLAWRCLKCTMPKSIVWILGWRPKHPYLCIPWARKGVFGYLGRGCLKCAMPKKCGVLAWRSKRAHICTESARKGVFGYLVRGSLKCAMSDGPILGIRNHLWWEIRRRAMRACGATPNIHIFWRFASYISKHTLAGRFGAEVCALGAPRQNPHVLASRIPNTPILRSQSVVPSPHPLGKGGGRGG